MKSTQNIRTDNPLTRGEVARLADVGLETVRFYENEGLIKEPPRKKSGYRQYSSAVVGRIRFIKHAKDLGFSLREISELLSLRVDPKKSCRDVKKRAEMKIEDIEQRINKLRKMKRALKKLADSCKVRGPTSECPILEHLDQ